MIVMASWVWLHRRQRRNGMSSQIKARVLVLTLIIVGFASPLLGQQKGQWVPGQLGLNTGVIPDPGITYANLALKGTPNLFRNLRAQAVCFSQARPDEVLRGRPRQIPWTTNIRAPMFRHLLQPSLPMGVLSCQSNYLNCDIASNIITRCQLLMFSILTWQLRHCGVIEVLPASFCWLR
jgi:hypothetical protein